MTFNQPDNLDHGFTSPSPGHTLVIGLGNDYRRDDGVGLYVARKLRDLNLPQTLILEAIGDAAALLELWKPGTPAILVDAVFSWSEPGTIFRFEAHSEPLPEKFLSPASSHAWGVAEAIELARTLKQLPSRLIVYGIEGKSFEVGLGLSPVVKRAAKQVVTRVVKELGRVGGGG
ncbi:MAG: hydrogenase maturation protease [Desulfobaccales bacterium]|nr:hydrogenase maturation protease [Desulfobaccales bacterium]